MHSVFWTLAKSNFHSAVQNTGESADWVDEDAGRIIPSRLHDDAQDFSYNAFIQESTLDEIAQAGGADPLELRRRLMAPYPIATRLIDAVARMSDWTLPLPEGRARGFAFAFSLGTWVAEVVEISRHAGGIRVERIFCAADVGMSRDLHLVSAKTAADIRHALAEATGREFAAEDTTPAVEVEVFGHSTQPGRPGAPAAQPLMPALANAIFALTGRRIRRTPLGDEIAFL